MVRAGQGGSGPADPTPELIAEVAPAAPVSGGDGGFDYRVPASLAGVVAPGVRVVVPLLGRMVEGCCLGLKERSDVPPDRLKDVSGVVDPRPAYPPAVLDLAVWTARRYVCQPGEVLRAAVPATGRFRAREAVRLTVPEPEAAAAVDELTSRAPVQAALLGELLRGPAEVAALRRRHGAGTARALAALSRRGLVALGDGAEAGPRPARPRGRVPSGGGDGRAGGEPRPLRLTPAQAAALAPITEALHRPAGGETGASGRERVFLLHGVTGSGKTEVFLRAASEALSLGRQVLVLVPEVSLVPQTLERVRAHLGQARVAVAHSYLGGRDRLDYWERVLAGEADVVVGARSAVFAPLDRLGLIVLDEEHEDAYKQEQAAPRYHAREVAVRRARREGAVLVLASATPSLESYWRALRGDYTLLTLAERVEGRPLPSVEIVDMRAELPAGNRSVFSRVLERALARTLADGQQAILFLNRRGHSTFVLCRDCGWVARCPNCDVSLTYHDAWADLLCHYCGVRRPPPAACPACGGHRVRYFGAGTQRLESEASGLFPGARVVRLDADVVRRPGEAARLLALFAAGQADILVGTQMVAKGLDVPGVGLVAAVSADSALHLPDFRAAERTFRLLTQAAGRAGRGDRPGQVIIQTYSPEHPVIQAARAHDYRAFAESETAARRALGYPPRNHLIRVEFDDRDERRAARAASLFARLLAERGFADTLDGSGRPGGPRFAGPAPAPLARLRGVYRWHVLVFCPDLDRGLAEVREAVREATGREARGGRRKAPGGVTAVVDVDPVSVL